MPPTITKYKVLFGQLDIASRKAKKMVKFCGKALSFKGEQSLGPLSTPPPNFGPHTQNTVIEFLAKLNHTARKYVHKN